MSQQHTRIFMFLLVLLAVTSCSKRQAQEDTLPEIDQVENVDKGLMTGDPCGPPCWQGIEPGDPKSQVLDLLEEISIVDDASIHSQPGETSWNNGYISWSEDERVEKILYFLEYRLELQDLIAVRGEPDGFTYVTPMHPGEEFGHLNLYWPEQGFGVSVASSVDARDVTKVAPVNPDSLVRSVYYFDPVPDAETYFLKYIGPPDEGRAVLDFYGYYPWNGYTPLPERD
jgi:hypothetical protein